MKTVGCLPKKEEKKKKTVGEMKCFSYSFTNLLVFVIKIRFLLQDIDFL